MAKMEVARRMNQAMAKQRGIQLSLPELVEVMDSIRTMTAIILALNQKALTIVVPAEALADTVFDCLCLEGQKTFVSIRPYEEGFAIYAGNDQDPTEADTFIELLDAWRHAHGKGPVEGVQITIPGTLVYQQLEQAITQQSPIMTPTQET